MENKEYFLVQDLGYDGFIVEKYATKEEAEKRYKESTQYEDSFSQRYNLPNESKIAIIEGTIIMSKGIEFS